MISFQLFYFQLTTICCNIDNLKTFLTNVVKTMGYKEQTTIKSKSQSSYSLMVGFRVIFSEDSYMKMTGAAIKPAVTFISESLPTSFPGLSLLSRRRAFKKEKALIPARHFGQLQHFLDPFYLRSLLRLSPPWSLCLQCASCHLDLL